MTQRIQESFPSRDFAMTQNGAMPHNASLIKRRHFVWTHRWLKSTSELLAYLVNIDSFIHYLYCDIHCISCITHIYSLQTSRDTSHLRNVKSTKFRCMVSSTATKFSLQVGEVHLYLLTLFLHSETKINNNAHTFCVRGVKSVPSKLKKQNFM
jgi:hypothetical protein